MKAKDDLYTVEMFGNGPGRARKPNVQMGVQRVRTGLSTSVTKDQEFSCTFCGGLLGRCSGICTVGQLGHISSAPPQSKGKAS